MTSPRQTHICLQFPRNVPIQVHLIPFHIILNHIDASYLMGFFFLHLYHAPTARTARSLQSATIAIKYGQVKFNNAGGDSRYVRERSVGDVRFDVPSQQGSGEVAGGP